MRGGGFPRKQSPWSTIHQAKGLEWSVVFLIGLCDGMFPHQRVIDDGDLAGLEEERRLFYVGITRAKDQLYLTYPRWNCRAQEEIMQMPPSFLDEFRPFHGGVGGRIGSLSPSCGKMQ